MRYFTLFALLFTLFSSCSNYHKNALIALPSPNINLSPIEADINVDKNQILEGISTTTITLGIFKSSDNKFADVFMPGQVGSLEKQAATYKALEGTEYDILVNPQYIVEIEKGLLSKKITAKVVGYGGKITIR